MKNNRWFRVNAYYENLSSIAGPKESNLFSAGFQGTVYHFDGNDWFQFMQFMSSEFHFGGKGESDVEDYDALGRPVTELINAERDPGTHQVDFDVSRLASSVYFYRLDALGKSEMRKLLFVK